MLYPNQIKKCRECGAEITFVKSSGGNYYPANVIRTTGKPEIEIAAQGGFVRGKQPSFTFPRLHRCPETAEGIKAAIDRLRDQLLEAEAALEMGSWFDATPGIQSAIQAWEVKLAALIKDEDPQVELKMKLESGVHSFGFYGLRQVTHLIEIGKFDKQLGTTGQIALVDEAGKLHGLYRGDIGWLDLETIKA